MTNRTITFEGTYYISSCTTGLYGHGGAVNYKSIDASRATFVVSNCNQAWSFDGSTANIWTQEESNMGRWEIGPWTDPETGISYDGCDAGFGVPGGGGKFVVNGGFMLGAVNPRTNGNTLCSHFGNGVIEIRDFEYTCRVNNNLRSNQLTGNYSANAGDKPVTILAGVRDLTPIATPRRKATFGAGVTGGHSVSQVVLHLRNWTRPDGTIVPTTIGDFQLSAGSTDFPAGLFVEAGCTFGMGNRTGPEIDEALAAAGLVPGTDFNISGQSWVVGLFGEVLSAPGWK